MIKDIKYKREVDNINKIINNCKILNTQYLMDYYVYTADIIFRVWKRDAKIIIFMRNMSKLTSLGYGDVAGIINKYHNAINYKIMINHDNGFTLEEYIPTYDTRNKTQQRS